MTRVELFEIIRRDHLVHQKSIREIAMKHRIHRRVVRQALASSVPPARKAPKRTCPVLTAEMRGVIDEWLLADRKAPRKQRHTARRIHRRLQREHAFSGAESTVRRYVGRRRRELGLKGNVFVPQDYEPGQEGEVDWYEAQVDFPWGREKVQVLEVRSCFSGREFHVAFPRQTQQAFLEGHVLAFEWFGGVFPILRYDNLSSAVKKVLRGRRREETDRFIALRSHYLFESVFCTPGVEGAHEKGGVEGGVGRFRRNHLVPVPKVADFDELNALLRDACAHDDLRRREGRSRTVLDEWEEEAPKLRSLPAERFDTAEVSTPRVDSKSRVKVRTNQYSVPVRLAGRRVEARVTARRVELVHEGKVVADHERLQGRHGERLKLDHYLELLHSKPGAFHGARPLRQAREEGRWPATYDALWKRMMERFGDADGTRQMIHVLMLHRIHPSADVHQAVEMALDLGCCDAGAIAVLLRQLGAPSEVIEPLQGLGELDHFGTEVSDDMSPYDRLIGGEVWA